MHERVRAALEISTITYAERRLDPSKPIRAANDVAKLLGVSTRQIAKTLLWRRQEDGQLLFAILSSPDRLDQAALEEGVGGLLAMAEEADLQSLGYRHGTVTAIGAGLPVFLDATLLRFDKIFVGSGEPMCEIELSPQDLAFVTDATVVKIT